MVTIKKKDLQFVGCDNWGRPVYRSKLYYDTYKTNYYYKDITLKGDADNIPSTLNCSYDDFDGEPDYEVSVVDE